MGTAAPDGTKPKGDVGLAGSTPAETKITSGNAALIPSGNRTTVMPQAHYRKERPPMTHQYQRQDADARPSAAIEAQRMAYGRASHRPSMGAMAHNLAAHMANTNSLQRAGDVLHAWGAMIAADVETLEIAVTPASSPSEWQWKLDVLRTISPDLDRARQGHVARLVDTVIAMETASPVTASLPPRRPVRSCRADSPADARATVIAPDELRQYAENVACLASARSTMAGFVQTIRDLAELRREGCGKEADGALTMLATMALCLCAVLAPSLEEAKAKVGLLGLLASVFEADAPLTAAVIKRAEQIERSYWPDA